jgi:uncharacterized protein DUF3617
MKIKLALLIGVLAVPACMFAATPGKPGKWEITTTMEMGGMTRPPVTHTICVTKEDLEKNPESMIPKGRGECKVSDFKTEGNVISWNMSCESERGTMTGSGKITYSGDTYDGYMTMKMGDRDFKANYKGKWAGPECDKSDKQ